VRRIAYPEYSLPDQGFSLSGSCSEDLDRFVEILTRVLKERLIPLALRCSDLTGVIEALRVGDVSAQRFDHALLLGLANRKDEALTEICDARRFFEAAENNFGQVNVMATMLQRLQKDLESKQGMS
jgi:hypothetical protein